MPRPLPAEFRRHTVSVCRRHEGPISQIAKDSGISEATRHNWLKIADIQDGARPGATEKEAAELIDARKRGSGCWSRRTRFFTGPRPSSPGRCPQNEVSASFWPFR